MKMDITENIKIWILLSITWLLLYSCSSTGSIDKNESDNEDMAFYSLIGEAQSDSTDLDSTDMIRAAKDYFIGASTLQQQGKYAEAILEYQQALKYDTSAAIYASIANNYFMLYKYEQAQEYVLRSLELNPNLASAVELLGNIYLIRMKSSEAQLAFERLVKLEPGFENKAKLANVYEINGNIDKAIIIYEELAAEGEEPGILMRLAGLYKKKKMDDKYELVLEKLYKYSPVKDRYAELLIEVYATGKKYDKIINLVEKLETDVLENQLETIYTLVGIYFNIDSTTVVDPYIRKLTSRFDNKYYMSPDINRLGGYLSGKINDTVKTVEFFGRFLNLTDTTVIAVLEVANFYLSKQWYRLSLELLQKYKKSFPENSMLPLYISLVYDEMDSSDKALEVLNNAVAIDSLNFDLWTQIGILNDKLGNTVQSHEAYNAALKIDPLSPLVNNNYAYSLSQQSKDLDRALAMINIALKKEPDSPSYLDTYAWIQYRLGNYNRALEYLNKAIEKGGNSAEIYDHLGDIHNKMGEMSKAKDSWLKALEIEPDNVSIKNKLELIK